MSLKKSFVSLLTVFSIAYCLLFVNNFFKVFITYLCCCYRLSIHHSTQKYGIFTHETNILCVSEYEMPPDFKCVWEKQVTSSLKVHEHIARTEKLFMLHPDKLHTFKGC